MKFTRNFRLIAFTMLLSLSFASCDGLFNPGTDDDEDETKDELYVKFENEAASQYTITFIEVRPRGAVGGTFVPTDNWSQNLLTANQTIAPGGHVFFTLEIPSGHWYEYRIGVDNGQGVQVKLHEQANYSGMTDLPITHWGGDDRTVSVSVIYSSQADQIIVNQWSDFTGI